MSQESYTQKSVTVCDACLRACCWNGIFHCDDYQTAGTVEKTIAELETLGAEHRDYYMDEEALRAENEEMRAERDALKAQLAKAQGRIEALEWDANQWYARQDRIGADRNRAFAAMAKEVDTIRDAIEPLTADNAALLAALHDASRFLPYMSLDSAYNEGIQGVRAAVRNALSQPHPGAQLLDVVNAASSYLATGEALGWILPDETLDARRKLKDALDAIRNREGW